MAIAIEDKQPSAKTVSAPAEKQAKQSEKKFGRAVMAQGVYIVPAMLLRAQARLLVSSTEMIVLLQLLDFWWTEDSVAYPSMATIGQRVSLSTKQVQRTVNALVEKGLISKTNRSLPGRGKTSNAYQFDGLIGKLKSFEPDFKKAQKTKVAASMPGGLIANKEMAE